MSDVKERPILMSAPMVLAILSNAKTQTRRIVKPQPKEERGLLRLKGAAGFTAPHCLPNAASPSPYGAPGDHLWVRETWRTEELSRPEGAHAAGTDGVRFPDGAFVAIENSRDAADEWLEQHTSESSRRGKNWRPSIHMPRWASRITLEITGVRVERLHEISESDARAEGVLHDNDLDRTRYTDTGKRVTAVDAFRCLWNELHHGNRHHEWITTGESQTVSSPWVWVVSFKRVMP